MLFHEAAAVYTTVCGANHRETVDILNQAKRWDGSGLNEAIVHSLHALPIIPTFLTLLAMMKENLCYICQQL